MKIPGRYGSFVLRLFGNRPPWQVCGILLGINIILIVVALLLPPAREIPTYYFQGLRLISLASFVQLVLIASLARLVFLERTNDAKGPPHSSFLPRLSYFWWVICLGFSFLAIDEIAAIHLYLDKAISAVLNDEGKVYSITISLYAIGAVGVLFFFWREVVTFRRSWLSFAAGFFCLAVAIAFDSKAIYRIEPWLPEVSKILLSPSGRGITEEAFEMFSGVFFITAMYLSLLEARRMQGNRSAKSNPRQ